MGTTTIGILLTIGVLLLTIILFFMNDIIILFSRRKYKIGEFVFIYDKDVQMPDKKEIKKLVNNLKDQFGDYLKYPISDFCCGNIEIYVTKEKPEMPKTRQKVKEYAIPQEHSSIQRKMLFDNKRGLKYTLGKHIADRLFPPGTIDTKKYEKVSYNSENEKWEINMDKEEVWEGYNVFF